MQFNILPAPTPPKPNQISLLNGQITIDPSEIQGYITDEHVFWKNGVRIPLQLASKGGQ